MEIHVPILPQVIFTVGPLVITNTLITSWIAVALLMLLGVLAGRNLRLIPSGFQNFAEAVVELLLALSEQAAGPQARKYLPIVGTLFLFIWFANWLGILPGVGTFPLFRSPNSDLSITLAMALIVFVWVQFTGMNAGMFAYWKKFLWPPGLNILELLQEFVRPISLALRLFGNILAGFILVEIMIQIVPPVIPAVFLGMELGVGLIQALIFSILTLAFLTLATSHGHTEGGHDAHHDTH